MIKIGKYFLSIHTACLLFVYSASGYAGTALHEDETSVKDITYGYTGGFIGMHFGY